MQPDDNAQHPRRTILVADDVAMFRELGSLFLARSARVVTASNGNEALELARSVRPDLILTDLHMPGMDGNELCRAVKADPELAQTHVILMIGPQDGSERARAVRSGADDVLVKPLNRVSLIEAVNRFLRWSEVRGLPRIDCSMPIEVECDGNGNGNAEGDLALDGDRATLWGTARNLSRGGLYVETSNPLELEREVRLRFALPAQSQQYCPTAQVVWRSERDTDEVVMGMGLRFLEIDCAEERQLDDYVFQHRFSRDLPLAAELP